MINFNKFHRFLRDDKDTLIIKENADEIWCRPRCGSKRISKLPLTVTPELCFLAGIILGDGHLAKTKFKITMEMTSKNIHEIVRDTFSTAFKTEFIVKIKNDKKINRKQRWKIEFKSKVIWLLFNKIFEIPYGKKSDIIRVPKVVFHSNRKCMKHFILGLFLADGGRKGKYVSFTSASEKFIEELNLLLKIVGVGSSISKWKNKKLNKRYFDLLISGNEINKFKELIPKINIKLNARSSRQGYPSLVKGAGSCKVNVAAC